MNYIIGKVVYVNQKYIILENSFMGYLINVANIEEYEKDKYKKVFVYERLIFQNNLIIKELYGFKNFKEKVLFEKLNKISGIGPKTAMQMLSHGVDTIKSWIINKSYDDFKKIKGLSTKTIPLIFSEIVIEEKELERKYTKEINEAIEALKALGYTSLEINKSLEKIDHQNLVIDSEHDVSALITDLIKNINEHQTT